MFGKEGDDNQREDGEGAASGGDERPAEGERRPGMGALLGNFLFAGPV